MRYKTDETGRVREASDDGGIVEAAGQASYVRLKTEIQESPELAWAWFSNIQRIVLDYIPSKGAAGMIARGLMRGLFQVEAGSLDRWADMACEEMLSEKEPDDEP